MTMKNFCRFAVITVFCLCFTVSLFAQIKPLTVIKAGRMVDTENGRVLTNQVIIVEGETIKAVGPGLAIPAGATVIEF